jgi:ketosteroid isomerase-like protein
LTKIIIQLIIIEIWLSTVSAQTSEDKAVIKVLQQNAEAFAKNDLATLEKIWANDESVTVFESGHANYGWTDYRDNHLAPEMKEMKNTKYEFSDIRAKISGDMAYATMKYTISGDVDGKHFDGAGLATAVLEKRNGDWKIIHWHSSAPRRQASSTPTPAKKS